MRTEIFKVVYQEDVGFCGEARVTSLGYFKTYEEAEVFALNFSESKLNEIWIQKVFVSSDFKEKVTV
jgi:hypothetical protein